jgi:hypothetical protein
MSLEGFRTRILILIVGFVQENQQIFTSSGKYFVTLFSYFDDRTFYKNFNVRYITTLVYT